MQDKGKRGNECCGKIIPVLEETEELIMLGGEKADCSNNSKKKAESVNHRTNYAITNNIDKVIESVVKDVSGAKTGVEITKLITGSLLPRQRMPITAKTKSVPNSPEKTNLVAKPAPASKKKFVQLSSTVKSKLSADSEKHLSHQNTTPSSYSLQSFDSRINDIVSSVNNDVYLDCSVASLDLFYGSPLKNLVCMGCLRSFNCKPVLPSDNENNLCRMERLR